MNAASWKAAGGRPRHAVKSALLLSAALHSLFLLTFVLFRTRSRVEMPVFDSRVPEGAFLLSLDNPRPAAKRPQTHRKGLSEGDPVTVHVAAETSSSAAEAGPPPRVDIRALPRSLPGQGGTEKQGGGAGRGARFFQVPVGGKSVVYVIDRSLSMGPWGGNLAAVRAELLASLEALPPSATFQVVFYNTVARPLRIGGSEGLLPADPETLRTATAALRSVSPEGNTDHAGALRCGLRLRPDVLFLVTDADDLSPEQVRALTSFNGGRTVIHTICVARRPHEIAALEQLAQANRGVCFCPGAEKLRP